MRNETPRQAQIRRMREQQGVFFDAWEKDFDKSFNRTFGAMVAIWVAIAIANLIVWGVVIWAIVQLVQWVQTK